MGNIHIELDISVAELDGEPISEADMKKIHSVIKDRLLYSINEHDNHLAIYKRRYDQTGEHVFRCSLYKKDIMIRYWSY